MEITGIRLVLLILLILAASVVLNMMIQSYESNCSCQSTDDTEGFSTYVGKNDLSDISDNNGIQSTIIATDSSKPRIFLRQGYHTTPDERNMVNRDDAIKNPRHDDILRYDGPGCFESGGSEKIRRVELEDRLGPNFDLIGPDEVRRYQLVNDPHVDRCRGKPQIASVNTGRRLTLTADGQVVDQHVNYYIPQTYLGAAGQRVGMPTGYPSLDDIVRENGEPADVDQIGAIPVNNFEGEPVPIGSITMS